MAVNSDFWNKGWVNAVAVAFGVIASIVAILAGISSIYPEFLPFIRGVVPVIFLCLLVGGFILMAWGGRNRIRGWPCYRRCLFALFPILLIVLWLGWPWPKIQGWFTGSSQLVVAEEIMIESCGNLAFALDGRLSITWVNCSLYGSVCLLVDDLKSADDGVQSCFKKGGSWQFRLDDRVYSLIVEKWPDLPQDTLVARLFESSAVDDTAQYSTLSGKSCTWYDVTFQELEIRSLRKPLCDSVGIQFVVTPCCESLWVAIDTIGTYPLDFSMNFVNPAEFLNIEVHRINSYIGNKIQDYVWPVHKVVWQKNDIRARGIHEVSESNQNIAYTLRYTIKCTN